MSLPETDIRCANEIALNFKGLHPQKSKAHPFGMDRSSTKARGALSDGVSSVGNSVVEC